MIGVGGGVAVGKSTVASELAGLLTDRGRRVDVVATDAFLHSNAVLAERDLLMRKGFPESYNLDAVGAFVDAVRAGGRVEVPVYSHATYDIVPGERTIFDAVDLVVLEGVIAVQRPVVEKLDASVYIDADEAAIRSWFVDRFLRFVASSADEPASFYKMFVGLPDAEVVRIAEATWDGINGVNLREHILPGRELATFVVEKATDHSIARVR